MIGVLALQGAFQKHLDCLNILNVPSTLIRYPHELETIDGLIIPGGETTVHLKLLQGQFWQSLLEFGKSKPIFGTCCGLILLSKKINPNPLPTLQFMDITVKRNAYGTQLDSFETAVSVSLDGKQHLIKGCFIRAPQITEVGKGVQVLATFQNQAVIVQEGHFLGCSFHPEVCLDLTLHQYFVQMCSKELTIK